MSGVVSTKVVIGVETTGAQEAQATIGNTTDSAKAAQRAFAELQNEQEAAYSSVTDLSTESRQQLGQLTESFARLRAEMQTLPDTLRAAVDGVLASLQRGDVGAAAALMPKLRDAPPGLRQQVERLMLFLALICLQFVSQPLEVPFDLLRHKLAPRG